MTNVRVYVAGTQCRRRRRRCRRRCRRRRRRRRRPRRRPRRTDTVVRVPSCVFARI